MKSIYTFGERDNLTELPPGTVVLLYNIVAGQILEGHLAVVGVRPVPLDKIPEDSFPISVVHVPPNYWETRWNALVARGQQTLQKLKGGVWP